MKYINPLQRAALKIKAKHLAQEARIIRAEEVKWRGHDKLYFKNHRKTTVRYEARATQLAIAYMRGVPYKVMERKCYDTYTRDTHIARRMASMILRYCNNDYKIPEPAIGEVKDWRERAKKVQEARQRWVQDRVIEWFNQE